MKYLRFATSSLLVGSLSLASFGSAMAADVTYDTTGPGSTNTVSINDTSNYSATNTNNVSITNTETQRASTGDVNVTGNTIAGSAVSGNATNNSTTTTTVAVNNTAAVGGSGNGSGGSGGSGNGSGGTVTPAGGSGSGNVLGASTVGGMGAGSLPEVGASSPVDVSALRSLYHPAAIVPPALANQSHSTSVAFLIAAAVLSLMGALGSAVYANRREQEL